MMLFELDAAVLPDPPWRPIPEFPGHEVSYCGEIRKRINRNHPERRQYVIFTPEIDKDGYHRITIEKRHFLVHRIVYACFCGDLEPEKVVCHRDGSRANNRWDNLLQATQKTNIGHKKQHGTHQAGEKHGRAQHTDDQISLVIADVKAAVRSGHGRLKKGTGVQIALNRGVSLHTVYHISNNQGWKHLYDSVGM